MDHGCVWHDCDELDELETVPHLPADEKWNSTQLLKRAAQNIPANIAEGYGRFHFLDIVRFCCLARGLLTEVQSHMTLTYELGYKPDEIYNRMTSNAGSISKQLNNYIACPKRSKQGEKDFPARYTICEEAEPYILDNVEEDTPDRP